MKTNGCIMIGLAGLLTACAFTQKIRTGTDAFSVRQYAVAARMFEDEYAQAERVEDKAFRAYMLGQCYEYMRQPGQAEVWYERAYQQKYGIQALDRQAEMLRQSEQYDKAIEAYQELMATGSDPQRYRGMITLCNQAKEWKSQSAENPYQVKEADFNSVDADYGPYMLGPDLLLFTSDREQSTGNATYQWTGHQFSDLYTVNLATGVVQPFDHVLNTTDNEGTVAMNAARSEMYFTRCFQGTTYDSYCQIMMCSLRGASWSEPEVMPFVQEGINYGHPVVTGKDSILIFSSNDPNGSGGYDLYYVLRTPSGWGQPQSLGDRINTIGNERFPSVYKDTLYFSSDHLPGLGGYDIFKTYLDQKGQWAPPLNLKAPMNSGWDDFGLAVDTFSKRAPNVLEQGYISSSRNVDTGDDIFFYQKMKTSEVPETGVVSEKTPDRVNYEVYVAIRVKQPVFANPQDPNTERVGTKPIPRAVVMTEEGIAARRDVTDDGGLLIVKLEFEKSYTFRFQKRGFLNQYRALNTTGISRDPSSPVTTISMEVVLEPIFEDMEIVLQDIYYDYDKWDIREDAKPSLDSLSRVMTQNPQLRIQLSSHTDCRGDDDYNLELSQKRAQSAVDYLVASGIRPERLQAVGYGESRLAVTCACASCTEEQHQKNRRTTFKILSDQ